MYIEPNLRFLLFSTGDEGGTDHPLNLGLGVDYSLPSGVNGVLPYERDDPGSDGEATSGTQFGSASQVGYRAPFLADNIRFRIGLLFDYVLESEGFDDPDKFTYPSSLGSWFLSAFRS